jgi:hypothetical protein
MGTALRGVFEASNCETWSKLSNLYASASLTTPLPTHSSGQPLVPSDLACLPRQLVGTVRNQGATVTRDDLLCSCGGPINKFTQCPRVTRPIWGESHSLAWREQMNEQRQNDRVVNPTGQTGS